MSSKIFIALKLLAVAVVLFVLVVLYQGNSYSKKIDINRFNAITSWGEKNKQLELSEKILHKCFSNDDGFREKAFCINQFKQQAVIDVADQATQDTHMPSLLRWLMVDLVKELNNKDVSIK